MTAPRVRNPFAAHKAGQNGVAVVEPAKTSRSVPRFKALIEVHKQL